MIGVIYVNNMVFNFNNLAYVLDTVRVFLTKCPFTTVRSWYSADELQFVEAKPRIYTEANSKRNVYYFICFSNNSYQTRHMTIICVIKWHQQIKSTFKNSSGKEDTLVAKSISWNVRKVSIGCDQRAHLWQQNKEYTTQTVIYTFWFVFLTITI